jgi:acetyl-CoA carboxylase biotin carboxyl carrier protein
MNLKDIKELIALFKRNDLTVFKLEQEGVKITLKRGVDGATTVMGGPVASGPVLTVAPSVASAPAPVSAPEVAVAPAGKEITSPMVGTFYSAPSPDSPAFVSVGQAVTPDTVICIIEAMKVMNEIKAEVSGVVTEVLAENGKPVQFGQALFRVK